MSPCTCGQQQQCKKHMQNYITLTQMGHKTQGQQWSKTVDTLCWNPDNVKAKLDREMHTMTITTRMDRDHRQPTYQPKRKQVFTLPRDINMEQLRVHLKPEKQQLVLVAPYLRNKDVYNKQQQCKYPQTHQRFPQELDTLMYTPIMIRDTQPGQWKKTQKTHKRTPYPGTLQAFSWFGSEDDVTTLDDKMLTTKVEKDDKTGKYNLIIDVNTVVGFQKREVKVTFEKEEQPLIVIEATRDVNMMQQGQEKKTADVFIKVLRQEIVVPPGVLGKQLRYCIKNNVLRIQLPYQQKPAKFQQGQEHEQTSDQE